MHAFFAIERHRLLSLFLFIIFEPFLDITEFRLDTSHRLLRLDRLYDCWVENDPDDERQDEYCETEILSGEMGVNKNQPVQERPVNHFVIDDSEKRHRE